MPNTHNLSFRVRYCETDAMGVMHHSHYVNYCEEGRTELLRDGGGRYRDMEDRGLMLVIVQFNCKYHVPARYDDLVTLTTTVEKVTPAKLVHSYEFRRDNVLLAEASTVLACVDKQGRVQRMAESLEGFV